MKLEENKCFVTEKPNLGFTLMMIRALRGIKSAHGKSLGGTSFIHSFKHCLGEVLRFVVERMRQRCESYWIVAGVGEGRRIQGCVGSRRSGDVEWV